MALALTFNDADGYLLARLEGEWTPSALSERIRCIASTAQERGYERVLVDIREMSAPARGFYRYSAGEDVAKYFGTSVSVAAVYRAELIDKFVENVAVNRGARFIVVPSFEEALDWLEPGNRA